MNQTSLVAIKNDLAQSGLFLVAGSDVSALPASVWLTEQHPSGGMLLLIGHGGKRFWEVFKQQRPNDKDPVDTLSHDLSEHVLAKHLPDIKRQNLFPAPDCPVNLMQLGQILGLHTPSPLGMGIHQEYGIWSAYRALWWLDCKWPETGTISTHITSTICQQCTTQDCIKTCPAEALELNKMPNLTACGQHRLQANSSCENTCLARQACPIAPEHRYSPEQMHYHYDLARSRLREYMNE